MHFRTRWLVIVALVIGTVAGAWYISQQHLSSPARDLPLEKLVLATPRISFSSMLFLAKHNNLFAKHGLDLQLVVTATGKEALEMTLAGKADIAAVATLPLTHALANGAKPRILAVVSKSDHEHSVVARRDRGISQPIDLKGKTIGILAGTSAQFYLEALLTNANMAREDVHITPVVPQDSQHAIASGEVDAVALFSPWDKRAANALGDAGIVFAPSLHTTHWTLSSSVRFAEGRRTAAEKMLRTLIDAQTLAANRREDSLDAVAQAMDIQRADLDESWHRYSFDVQLQQSLITTLEREIMWIRSHESAAGGEQSTSQALPDFLDYIWFSPLQSVSPSAVRITR